ncbi:unnamed protein product [Cylindrotheca closterium]|uniref:Membrane insertase YidC/Oxa/ALB C-terminal domain-containing protein n=1 Tax=Cylindrotheca closterium TaxID=2856 RepID=A0AAD2CD29_9STRA|nr:unnamed protein product [Cylindrotheca closterium]
MKLSSVSTLLLLASAAEAFAPTKLASRPTTTTTARSLMVDPTPLQDIFSSISLADAADAVADVGGAAADAAAQSSNGWFGFLTGPIKGLLEVIHTGLVNVGVKENAWGITIISMTLIIKALTFPLTKTQLESTNKMQALQPVIKDIQAKYQSNPEVMNQKISEVYQTNEVNPLAGCLPSLAQIPIFIGLYRGVLDLAKNNALDEPFLFLPNLEGPVYGADPTQGSSWLTANWVDGAPSLGWDDTLAFLVLPVFLVISQFVSMELMQPKQEGEAAQQSNAVLKFLPLMIGWFSLNVPAALCIYWVTNNIVTTATSLLIRNSMSNAPPVAVSAGSAASAPPMTPEAIFAPSPLKEKASGFGSDPDVTPITGAIDAEVIDNDSEGGDDAPGAGMMAEAPSSKKRGGKKKKRRKN